MLWGSWIKAFVGAVLLSTFWFGVAEAGQPLLVGIFVDRRSKAVDEIKKALEENGMTAELFQHGRRADYSEFQNYDVLFFGGGYSSYDWLSLEGRMHLIELVEQRGGGAVFSMFRCGSSSKASIRPLFPDIAHGFNKVNSSRMIVVDPGHPIMEGLPGEFMNPYFDHAVLRLGPLGRALAENTSGEVTVACGKAGFGRVVFIGPWIGVDTSGRNAYPLPGHDEQLLLNSIRWAADSPYRDRKDFTELSEETQIRVLRRERVFDWTHNERGMSWNPGLLPQAGNRREQVLDDLYFRLSRLDPAAEQVGASARLRELQENIVRLKDELRANIVQAVRQKKLEISRMSLDELRVEPFPTPRGSDERRLKLLAEWEDRLMFPYIIENATAEVTELENELKPVLRQYNERKFAERRAEDAAKVRGLVSELDSADPAVRANSALELGRIGDSGRRTVNALIKALEDNNYKVRRNAIYALSWIREKRAVQPLVKLLENHNDTRTRRRAAQALGQIGDRDAVESLINALNDADYHVRQNAILALGWTADKRAAEPLMDIVKKCATERHAEFLARSDRSALYITEQGWDTADMTCAIRALGHIGDASALDMLSGIAEMFSEESASGHLSELAVVETVEKAIASIENGGRGISGIGQLEQMHDKDHFYWMTGRYNALYGRYTSWRGEPPDFRVMLSYAAAGGGTGTVEFNTPDKIEERQPDIDTEEYLKYAEELGLKINLEMRHRAKRFDKAGMEYDVMRVGKYASFGGLWGEEALYFDEARRAIEDVTKKEFREFLENKYSPEKLEALGIDNVAEVELPVPDNKGPRPVYLRSGPARTDQKVLFAEYLEFLADQGVEQWEEAQEWLAGMRKGAKMSFSLSDRYVHSGSTYISAYPRVNLALDAGGPQTYGAHASLNNFKLDMHVDGESRPAQGEFYGYMAHTPARIERGFAASFVYGQQFFNHWWSIIFKHFTDTNAGNRAYEEGRWEAAVRQFTKGKALSEYLAPGRTTGARLVTQLYSGRTTTLSYGDGTTDSFGGNRGETMSPNAFPFRYTQNQHAFWESIVRSHLPVEMTWLETQYPEKLARYKVAVLTDGVSLDARETDMLREWVRNGGTLIATASSTLHDQWDRPLQNYSLADVFGVDYVRTEGEPSLVYVDRDIKPASGITEIRVKDPEYFLHMEGAVSAEYEKGIGYDVIEPTTARIVGVWDNDETPALLENRFGDGHVIFIAARYPALSHLSRDATRDYLYNEYWPGMRELLAACVRRGLELTETALPLEAENCPETVDVVLKRQEQNNRWMAHLLNIDEKNGLIQEVKLTVRPPHTVKSVYYAYPERAEVDYTETDNGIELIVRPFDVHEMVVVEWAGGE